MAMLQMQRIYIYALKKDRKPLLEMLQRRQVVEITDVMPEDTVFQKSDMSYAKSSFEKIIHTANEAADIINRYAPEEKPLLSLLNGRTEISAQDYDAFKEKYEKVTRIANTVINCNKEIIENNAEIQKLRVQAEILAPWISLDIPLGFSETKSTKSFIGTIPRVITLDELYEKLSEYSPVTIDMISSSKEQTCIFVLCTKNNAEGVFNALRQIEFALPGVSSNKAPSEQLKQIEKQIADAEQEIKRAEEKIFSFSSAREDLMFLQDYNRMRYDKYDVIGKILQSKNVFMLSGFIPKKAAKELEEAVSRQFDAAVEFETPQKEEEVPVLLTNNGFSEPVEGVVEGFSLPGKHEVDPTMVVALFYYFLFGLMLSDLGYGLLMIIVCGFCLWKGKNGMEKSTRNFLKMFLFCGVSTAFWGIMFGGFFGDILDVFATKYFGVTKLPVLPAVWFYPVNKPMQMLSFSMLLGIIHILTGLGVKIFQMIKLRDYKGVVYDTLTWFVLVVSCTFLLLSMDMIKNILGVDLAIPTSVINTSAILAVLSAVVIVLTNGRESKNPFKRFLKGVYALYGITGYLSDVLSYSRLLALGLATGVIASVINKMASMTGKGVLGFVIMVVIMLFGHTINFAINALGAYVHTNRLEYVEFFGKFYEGGGRSFHPFHMNTKYYKIKEGKE